MARERRGGEAGEHSPSGATSGRRSRGKRGTAAASRRQAARSSVTPAISVAVAVRHRPEQLAQTLRSIFASKLPNPALTVEALVILGPGEDEPDQSELRGEGGPLLVIRTDRSGLGTARRAALAAARGEFLAVCDAGDVWSPDCLATLLPPLLHDPNAALAFAVAGDVEGGMTLADSPDDGLDQRAALRETPPCAAVVRTAAARSAGGYAPPLTAAADLDLWLRLAETETLRAVAVPEPVAIPARPTRDEAAVLAAELAHLERLAARRRDAVRTADRFRARRADAPIEPFDPATWDASPGGRRELLWHSRLRRSKRLGPAGRHLLAAVARQGMRPLITPFSGDVPADLLGTATTPARWDRLAFLFDPVAPPDALRVERLVRYAGWDTTDVPRSEVEAINRHVSLLCVPCRQNRDDALAAGVAVPVVVLPPGVDPGAFPFVERPAREPFTFGTFGEPSPRSGIDVLLRAFRAAFRAGDPVRLLITGTGREPRDHVPEWDDPRIAYRGGWVEGGDPAAVLSELDACVLPSRGEAFAFRGLEAMATGLPTIATAWSGPADYLDPADSLPLGYRLVEAGGVESNDERHFGRWAEPDEAHLIDLLRWVFDNREAAAAMGRTAAARVRADWTWDQTAVRLRDLLDALAAGVSPA